jgi:5,6,7,8-tetrahydromethanopterin hydro-lyase
MSNAVPNPPHRFVPVLIGEGFEGSGASVAHVKLMIGDRYGPVGHAFATALATPTMGHEPFLVVARPGLPVKPFTLFVATAAIATQEHATLTWGAAQAGIAGGVVDAVAAGFVPADIAELAVVVASVWVDPSAGAAHQDAVYINNRAAMATALENASTSRPSVHEVMADESGVWNPFFTP